VVPARALAAGKAGLPIVQHHAKRGPVVMRREGPGCVRFAHDRTHLIVMKPPVRGCIAIDIDRPVPEHVADHPAAKGVVFDRHRVRKPHVVEFDPSMAARSYSNPPNPRKVFRGPERLEVALVGANASCTN